MAQAGVLAPSRAQLLKNGNNGWSAGKSGKVDQAGDGWTSKQNGKPHPPEDSWAAGNAQQEPEDDSAWGGGKQESKAAPESRYEPKKPDHKGSLWVPSSRVEGEISSCLGQRTQIKGQKMTSHHCLSIAFH